MLDNLLLHFNTISDVMPEASTRNTMKAKRVVFRKKDTVEVETFDLPEPTGNEVVVEAHYTAISPGTELALLRHAPNTSGDFPRGTGYSGVGTVVAVGPDVQTLTVGQRVAGQIRHASHSLVKEELCTPLPERADEIAMAPYRLVCICLQGVRKARVQLGHEVAVVGCGPIGNLAGQLAHASGATWVEGIEPVRWRGALAYDCGFDAHVTSLEEASRSAGFDSVIESTGVPDVITGSFQLARRMGRVILLGSTRGITEKVNFYLDVHRKGLQIIGAHDSTRPDADDIGPYWTRRSDDEAAIKLIAAGRINTQPLVSDVVLPDEAPSAYERLISKEERLMTIAFKWN